MGRRRSLPSSSLAATRPSVVPRSTVLRVHALAAPGGSVRRPADVPVLGEVTGLDGDALRSLPVHRFAPWYGVVSRAHMLP